MNWRTVAPVDCVGFPDIALQYQRELVRLAAEQRIDIPPGATVTANYQRIDGLWWPVPETLKVTT